MTHTYAELELSKAAYDEIAAKLRAAGYGHAFMEDGAIDMHGIGVTCEKGTEVKYNFAPFGHPPERCPSCERTDAEFNRSPWTYKCRDPWHSDSHLRAKRDK